MCGGDLNASNVESVLACEYCGTTQTIPTSRDEEVTNLFNRAEILRKKCDFDKAEGVYERIVEIDPNESEAYWGLILCKFGIEYVTDPQTSKRIPTCHRTSYDAIVTDEYYLEALKHADVVQKSVYEKEAAEIDRIQKRILAVSSREEPYDVFICYKESDATGRRTRDSVLASEIYHELCNEGFRVFYAAITLEEKLGEEYEPYIFSALNSAKVMLVVGTKPEYFNAVWVKNEWSRFLKIIKRDRSKKIIPCYRDMDAYDLPDEFSHLQAQDMSKLGFVNDLVRGIKKIISIPNAQPQQTVYTQPAVTNETQNRFGTTVRADNGLENAVKRAMVLAEEGDFYGADAWANKCLDIDFECAEAYVVKLMALYKVSTIEGLANAQSSFIENINYKRAIRFAQGGLGERLTEVAKERDYNQAKNMCFDCVTEQDYENVRRLLLPLGDYKDTQALIQMCEEKIQYINTMELREETDKRLLASAISPIAESACRMAHQTKVIERMMLDNDDKRKKKAVSTLIVCIVTIFIFLFSIMSPYVALVLLGTFIATYVMFFKYVGKYMPKNKGLFIFLAVFTLGYFSLAIPIIMGFQIKKCNDSLNAIKEEQNKLKKLEKNFNDIVVEIDDLAIRNRIKQLAYSGYGPLEIAHIISEEQIDYI